VFGFGKKGRTQVGAVSGFGKIPALGDFVRTSGASDEANAFETWLTRAMEDGEARGGTDFRTAYAAGAAHSFLWSGALNGGKARGVLAGVIVPSHDAVGRRFPVAVCAPLPVGAFAACPHLGPLVLHEFFHHARTAAQRAAVTRSAPEFNAQIAAVSPPSLDKAPASAAEYASWAKARRASDVWSELFPHADATFASQYALYMLVESTAAYRGQDAPPLSLGVRVPLGDDARMGAAMWVDLVRHAAGWKANVPSIFWPVSDASSAIIFLGAEAPASALTALWEPLRETDAVCDVTPSAAARAPSELPALVQRALAEADASISSVASELGR
jgi:type VI secretion system ImpM family protein